MKRKRDLDLLFLYSYLPLKRAAAYCDDSWGYALISHTGQIIKLFASPSFVKECNALGLNESYRFVTDEHGSTAVSHGLQHGCEALSDTGHPEALKNYAISFSPIMLNVRGIQRLPQHLQPYSFIQYTDTVGQENIQLFGGVALLAKECKASRWMAALSDAIANEIFIQLHWFNLTYQDYTDDICTLTLDQSRGENQVTALSSNAKRLLDLTPTSGMLVPLESIVAPPPANGPFWEIVNGHKSVDNFPLQLERNGQIYDVSITTRPSCEPKFFNGEFVITIQSLFKINQLKEQYADAPAHFTFHTIIHGHAENFKYTIRQAELAAASTSNILLTGESGTGKDVLAQAIHNGSPRKKKPFIAINCAAFSKELITSELFGYEAGAYTGAKKNGSIGKFELANGGTLFLDEIGDMPLDLQSNLLRAIEQKRFMKVGGTNEIMVDVRIIAATNKNLRKLIEQKLFREDLYYRLGVVKISIPPLRERTEDILPLANYYLSTICRRQGKPVMFLSEEAKEALRSYPWPGNVRELGNLLEGIVSINDTPTITGEMLLRHLDINHIDNLRLDDFLPDELGSLPEVKTKGLILRKTRTIGEAEILQALKAEQNNVQKAAQRLGISRRTLYRRLHEFGLIK